MFLEIQRTYHFDAAHKLLGLEDGHPCSRLHGHRFRVDIVVRGEPNAVGMICDFRRLDRIVQPLLDSLDHCYLNDIEGLSQPTVENLALWLVQKFQQEPLCGLSMVRVWESDRSCAQLTVSPSGNA